MYRIALLFFVLCFVGFTNDYPTTEYKFPKLRFFPVMPVSASNPVTIEGAELGKYLFYDSILSVDYTLSCASCHKQASAFSDSPNVFSKGRNGVPMRRNTMPLFNLAWHPSLFWDGRASSIEDQVFHPVREYNEMSLDWSLAASRLEKNKFYREKFRAAFGTSSIDSVHVSYAIGQFLRTLVSHESKYDQVLEGKSIFTKDEYEGFVLANEQTKGDCIHCHLTDGDALGASFVFSNNGLDATRRSEDFEDKGRGEVTGKISDYGKFKVPTLRNLAYTAPYMHDGRFSSLEEVIDFYSEGLHYSANIDSKMGFVQQGGARLTGDEKRKIIAFLLTLSDSSFVTNPEFSNPFEKR